MRKLLLVLTLAVLGGPLRADTIDVVGLDNMPGGKIEAVQFLFNPETGSYLPLPELPINLNDLTFLSDSHSLGVVYYCLGRNCTERFERGLTTSLERFDATVDMWEDGTALFAKLNPVATPEPTTLLLLGLGLFVIVAWRDRRKCQPIREKRHS